MSDIASSIDTPQLVTFHVKQFLTLIKPFVRVILQTNANAVERMQKTEFLHVTGENETALRNWLQKRVMPWPLGDRKSKWSRFEYSPWRAVLYLAFKQLLSSGLSGAEAAEILLRRELQVLAGPIVAKAGDKPGEYTVSRGGRSSLLPKADVAEDKWLFVPSAADRGDDAVDELFLFPMTMKDFARGFGRGDYWPAGAAANFRGFVMVNLTQAVRVVQARADEINLELEW